MSYDLRHEPWIPWLRRSGRIEWGPPALLTDRIEKDPVVALATPRPDFDGALQEFLIGLLTVALQPADDDAWYAGWLAPPSSAELQAAFDMLPEAFDLDGDGARVFQDRSVVDFADVEPTPIDQILIDAAGGQTARLNKDLFVKRNRVDVLGQPAAAMALITLQTYAPAGGQGHRTSLRGGGPLTTLVDPRVDSDGIWHAHDQPLWYKLWANVETRRQWERRAPEHVAETPSAVFPWLAATRVSDSKGGCATTPADAHPLQAYFGLPRRIRLEFGGPGRCALTGQLEERTVIGFRMRNYGVQYQGWRHPLSPYYRAKANAELLPMHGQPGGVGWRDWLGLTLLAPEGETREPARAIAAFHGRADVIDARTIRVHAFGYDMDNMKARGWIDASLPAFAINDPARQLAMRDAAGRLTEGTSIAGSALQGAVERALFSSPDDATGDFSLVKTELWSATEDAFYTAMRRLATGDVDVDSVDDICIAFVKSIEPIATSIFDRWCSGQGSSPEAMRRLVAARFNLVMTLRGLSSFGEKMFDAFRIPKPGGGRAARTAIRRSRKEAAK